MYIYTYTSVVLTIRLKRTVGSGKDLYIIWFLLPFKFIITSNTNSLKVCYLMIMIVII